MVKCSVRGVFGDESDGSCYGFFTPGFEGDRGVELGVSELVASGGLAQLLKCLPPKRRGKRQPPPINRRRY
jgi:hypothetical protein